MSLINNQSTCDSSASLCPRLSAMAYDEDDFSIGPMGDEPKLETSDVSSHKTEKCQMGKNRGESSHSEGSLSTSSDSDSSDVEDHPALETDSDELRLSQVIQMTET